MPSPILPSDFCDITPTPSSPPCDALKAIFFDLPGLLCQFFGWMFNEDGTISEAFRRELNAVPAGLQANFGGLTVPDGWLFCNGAAYKRADYPYLYAAIGTRFGSGNGVDEFQVPDMGGRTIVGVSSAEGYSLAQTGGSNEFTIDEDNIPPVWIGVEGVGETGPGETTTGYLRVGGGLEVDFAQGSTNRYAHSYDGNGGDREVLPVQIQIPFIVMTPCIKT